jgi:hypothetical protein
MLLISPTGLPSIISTSSLAGASLRALLQRAQQNELGSIIKAHFSTESLSGVGLKPTAESTDPPVLSEEYIVNLERLSRDRPDSIPVSRTPLCQAATAVISEPSAAAH